MLKAASAPRFDTDLMVHEVVAVPSSTPRHGDRAGKLAAGGHPVNRCRPYRRDELDAVPGQAASPARRRRQA